MTRWYIIGNSYLVQECKGAAPSDARACNLEHITLCQETKEVYFHMRVYQCMIENIGNCLPSVNLGALQKDYSIFAYHRIASMESMIIHQIPCLEGARRALIVKY